jgi:molybdopterin-containing oxidoreductase family iron-sulfur binding subunit
MAACPYSSRVFNWGKPNPPVEKHGEVYSPETSSPSLIGTVEKCDFCPDSIRKGELPPCIPACPNGALYFGDEIDDAVTNGFETVRFTELLREKAGYRYLDPGYIIYLRPTACSRLRMNHPSNQAYIKKNNYIK